MMKEGELVPHTQCPTHGQASLGRGTPASGFWHRSRTLGCAGLCLVLLLCAATWLSAAEPSEPAAPAQRIVSLAPGFTELLFALDLGDRVVGVTRYCLYPPEAKAKPKVGGFADPDLEKIAAQQPDLVLGVPVIVQERLYGKLESMHIRVLKLPTDTLAEIQQSAVSIAEAAGVPERGKALAEKISGAFDSVRKSVADLPRPKVAFIVGFDPLVLVGGNTYLNELIGIAGGENIAGKEKLPYVKYSFEELLVAAPDVIVNAGMGSEADPKRVKEIEAMFARWTSIPAVKNNRICPIDFTLATTPGPRVLETAETLARILHPEKE